MLNVEIIKSLTNIENLIGDRKAGLENGDAKFSDKVYSEAKKIVDHYEIEKMEADKDFQRKHCQGKKIEMFEEDQGFIQYCENCGHRLKESEKVCPECSCEFVEIERV
jgi:RNA 3'-terminal phosphate cyclase